MKDLTKQECDELTKIFAKKVDRDYKISILQLILSIVLYPVQLIKYLFIRS